MPHPNQSPPGQPVGRVAQLAEVASMSRLTGYSVRVLPHDEIIKIMQTDDYCSVLIRRHRVREYRYQTCFDAASLMLFSWVRDAATGRWAAAGDPVTMTDTDFTPYRRQE